VDKDKPFSIFEADEKFDREKLETFNRKLEKIFGSDSETLRDVNLITDKDFQKSATNEAEITPIGAGPISGFRIPPTIVRNSVNLGGITAVVNIDLGDEVDRITKKVKADIKKDENKTIDDRFQSIVED
jgi:hypothetical protein